MSRRSSRNDSAIQRPRHRSTAKQRPAGPYSRRLRFEPLEDRRLLSITVNTLVDEADGSIVDGDISLRDAIVAAPVGETIDFSVTGTISLTSLGQLTINKNLTINGPGANLLTIKAYDPDANGANDGDGSRVFNIDDGNAANVLNVSISGLTLTNGDSLTSGGAIRSMENLVLTDSTVSGNWSSIRGGGIYSNGANSQLTLVRSTVSGNAALNNGAGVATFFGNTSIDLSTISGNFGNFSGGGVFQYGGQLTVTRSTISGNSTNNRGGGIYTALGTHTISDSLVLYNTSLLSGSDKGGGGIGKYGGSLTITNTTLSRNTADQNGGGILNDGGTLTVRHSTLTNNWSDVDTVSGGQGGAIFVGSGTVSVDHTIVAFNLSGFFLRDDIFGAVAASSAYNLIGVNTNLTGISNGTNGNQIGTDAAPINPLLGQLIDNGGPTKSYSLLPGSPAIDAGNAAIATPPSDDQRGAPFARIADGDGAGGARIDIGAYERQTVPGLNLVVDTLFDEYDSNFAAGDLSLREAISLANGSIGAETITFAAALTSGGPATILLTKGELTITDSVAINGPNDLSITIDASGNDPTPTMNNGDGSRVFNIDNSSVTLADVLINLLILTGGDAAGSGGAIFTRENLTLLYSTITGNATSASFFGNGGGGIYSSSGSVAPNSLSVVLSTISNNTATGADGGGIRKRDGSLFVAESTISGNFAGGAGGGISAGYGNIDVDIAQSTLASNTAFGGGGGVFLINAVAVISDSTIQGNQGNPGGGGLYSANNNLTINRSRISGNSATDGGGILNIGSISLNYSTVSGNSATTGGGISHNEGNLTVTRSTISGNGASQGGGILSETLAGFSTSIVSSTISLNVASATGGGVFNAAGNTFIRHSTLTANQAPANAGGGIASQASGTLTFLTSTIVSNNVFGNDVQFVGGATNTFASGGYNLVGTGNAATGPLNAFFQVGDQAGTGTARLGPLADHGGYTKTHALLPGSTAIDAGNPSFAPPPSFDQRGFGFARVFDGDGVGGARIDIGAYERQTLPGLSLVVDTLVDENDQIYSPGDRSLREAIALANGSVGADTITFAPSLTAGGLATIHLSLGEFLIDESLTITGPGANLLRLDAAGSDPTPALKNGDGSRIFNITNVNFPLLDVTISGLMLNGGDAGGAGGAILTLENLTITDSIITGNSSSSSGIRGGGAIYSAEFGSSLIVRDSTISYNSAVNSEGGAIRVRFGSLLVERSTIASNSAHSVGGGISAAPAAGGTVEIRDSEVTGNASGSGSSYYGGGGVFLFDAVASITGSTISGNEAVRQGGGIDAHLGSLTITGSMISNNESTSGPGGGIHQRFGSLTVDESTIAENTAFTVGGGIAATAGGDVEIRDSTISGNLAKNDGGGVYLVNASAIVTGSTITNNVSMNSEGGGIRQRLGSLVVERSTITGNDAFTVGGGISAADGGIAVDIRDSTISGNSSGAGNVNGWGGGGVFLFVASAAITGSTISGNSAQNGGGGVFLYAASATITNSTMSGNLANVDGGGIHIWNTQLSVLHTTITGNGADADNNNSGQGGGVFLNSSTIALDHTIVAGNVQDQVIADDVFGPLTASSSLIGVDTGAMITDNGGNLIGTTGSPVNPLLGSLADNGGPTMTHALLPGSPAIDAGDPSFSPPPDFDQRGNPLTRVYDGVGMDGARIDIGAFELQPIGQALPGDYNQNNVVDAADYTVWRDALGQNGVTPYSGADGSGNGIIGPEDYDVWKSHFGETLPPGAGGGAIEPGAGSDEPGEGPNAALADFGELSRVEPAAVVPFGAHITNANVASRPRPEAGTISLVSAAAWRDAALLAWLATRFDMPQDDGERGTNRLASDSAFNDLSAGPIDAWDAAFEAQDVTANRQFASRLNGYR